MGTPAQPGGERRRAGACSPRPAPGLARNWPVALSSARSGRRRARRPAGKWPCSGGSRSGLGQLVGRSAPPARVASRSGSRGGGLGGGLASGVRLIRACKSGSSARTRDRGSLARCADRRRLREGGWRPSAVGRAERGRESALPPRSACGRFAGRSWDASGLRVPQGRGRGRCSGSRAPVVRRVANPERRGRRALLEEPCAHVRLYPALERSCARCPGRRHRARTVRSHGLPCHREPLGRPGHEAPWALRHPLCPEDAPHRPG